MHKNPMQIVPCGLAVMATLFVGLSAQAQDPLIVGSETTVPLGGATGQNFTIPAGVTRLRLVAYGSDGGTARIERNSGGDDRRARRAGRTKEL